MSENKQIISFIGLPASGKGTQVDLLVKKMNARIVGIGNLVRAYIKDHQPHDEEYEEVYKLTSNGRPVPDEFVFKLIKEYIEQVEEDTLVFDNFPFNQKQSELFDTYIKEKGFDAPKIIYINVDPEVVIKRMTLRLMCPKCGKTFIKTQTTVCPECNIDLIQRADDNEETVRNRIESYMPNIEKIVDIYSKENLLIEINGDQSIEAVSKEIESKLNE